MQELTFEQVEEVSGGDIAPIGDVAGGAMVGGTGGFLGGVARAAAAGATRGVLGGIGGMAFGAAIGASLVVIRYAMK